MVAMETGYFLVEVPGMHNLQKPIVDVLQCKVGAKIPVWLRDYSGRIPDSQSSEPGFELPFATVSKIGHFRSLH